MTPAELNGDSGGAGEPGGTALEISPAIFESTDAWAAYLSDAQARLAARRKAQELRAFWQAALQQADELLRDAQAASDEAMEAELTSVSEGFRARLGGDFQAAPISLPLDLDAATEGGEAEAVAEAVSPIAADAIVTTPIAEPAPQAAAAVLVEVPVEAPAAAAPPLPDPEADARQHAVAEAFLDVFAQKQSEWAALRAQGLAYADREWNRPNLFRMRGIACAVVGLFVRAQTQNVGPLVRTAAINLREQMRAERVSVGERHEFVAFDEAYWVYAESGLPAEVWQELSRRYFDMAEAQTVWEWFLPHEDFLGRQTRHDLLNALLSVHQGLCRRLEMAWGRDPLLTTVFYQIRNDAQDAGFLNALSSETTTEMLDENGAKLQKIWQEAQSEAKTFAEKQAKGDRKKNAIDAVVALMTDCGNTAPNADLLVPLLEECLACDVPPTNAAVRNALLHHGPMLLAGRARFGKILEAVRDERRRSKMDEAPHTIPTPETENDDEAAAGHLTEENDEAGRLVERWLGGKKVLILGGIPRQRTCDELKRACGCAEVQWPLSTETDTAAKFKSDIQKSDALLLLKNFARHDMSKRGREWVTEKGGHFVFITGGYGVQQILRQLGEYAALNKLVEA